MKALSCSLYTIDFSHNNCLIWFRIYSNCFSTCHIDCISVLIGQCLMALCTQYWVQIQTLLPLVDNCCVKLHIKKPFSFHHDEIKMILTGSLFT